MSPAIIAAISGILGVLVGGWITAYNQRKERLHNRIREQLDSFYAPLLGLRAQILAKSETRLKVTGATGQAWTKLMSRIDGFKVEDKIKIENERFPDFEKVIEKNDRQFIEEIMPLYREMIKYFSAKMGLAQPSTRMHFGVLVEFVEIWDRWLDKTLPQESLEFIGHSEDNLMPFYQDLSMQLDSLSQNLKKT